MNSLVSIIVPVYNTSAYLAKCLDSLLNQSHPNIEIIVINDGSTDNSGSLCNTYAENYPKRVLVLHTENSGVCHARNVGLKHARGNYICFVDSDDWVEPNFIQSLFQLITRNNAQLASVAFIHESNGKMNSTHHRCNKPLVQTCYEGESMYGVILNSTEIGGYLWNKIFIKKLITTPFNEKYAQCEDFLFITEYLLQASKLVVSNEPLYHYRRAAISDQSLTISPRLATLPQAYEEILLLYEKNALSYANTVRFNLLKIYLNFYSRCKLSCQANQAHLDFVKSGISRHWGQTLYSKLKFSQKALLFLAYMFPITTYKLKRWLQEKEQRNGHWR